MPVYSVGELYHPGRTNWPECAQYSYRSGADELLLFLRDPNPAEVKSVRKGDADFALVVRPPLLVLCYRFRPAIPWSDAPYSWHLVAPEQQTAPPFEVDQPHALLSVMLIDAATGIIRAIRALTFSPDFTAALQVAIAEQAAQPWDQRQYDDALAALYAGSTSEQLVTRAVAMCRGGA